MDIIISHQLTDFDGLAAMIAAKKLYPEAELVFSGRLQNLVKDFMALYRDEIEVAKLSDIDLTKVQKIIIVDTANLNSLGNLQDKLDINNVEVIVYDHHPHEKLDWINLDLSEKIGASTTILVKKLMAEDKELNPLEATICALGIYADTGSLTNDGSTPDDARAVAYLLKSGANLEIIRQFLEEALNAEQQIMMEKLLDNRKDLEFDGLDIAIFSYQQSDYMTGINRIAEKIKKVYHLSTVFLIVKMGKKTEIIGRSSDDAVNIGSICSVFGGGGHSGAGAAQSRKDLSYLRRKLRRVIKLCVQPIKRVNSIMSTPVRTISPDRSMKDAEKFIEKYGHNGVVVCDGNEISGIFSRRDLEKVKGHDLMHAPVKGYMSKKVITVEIDAPIKKAQELMVKYNIGRLPVLKDNKLVGIVTRSDVLGSYYEHRTPHQYQNRYGSSLVQIEIEVSDIKDKLNYFPENVLEILQLAGKVAQDHANKLFLIGGMVRDLLLDRPNRDFDLVIEGDLREFLFDFKEKIDGKVSYNDQFGTATVVLPSGYNLDFATTRKEKYNYSGALPEVERTNILEDLFRRDYTVNALAIALNPDKWGKLYDFFKGKKDLKDGILRALHRFSFLDDPTRIIRGVRLALSLDFGFEKETEKLMREALEMGDFNELSPARAYKELKILFTDGVNEKITDILEKLPIFKLIDGDFSYKNRYKKEIEQMKNYSEKFRKRGYKIDESILTLALFFNDIPFDKYKELNLTVAERNIFAVDKDNLLNRLSGKVDRVELCKILGNISIEKMIYLLAVSDDRSIRENIKLYIDELSEIKLEVDGNSLIEMGLKPGPIIKKVLQRIWEEKLKENISTEKEERKFALELIEEEME